MVMSGTLNNMIQSVNKYQEQGQEWMERLLAAARPGAVFGEPVTSGSYTVITASEIAAGGGFGYGIGGGRSPASTSGETPGEEQENSGGGGGIGGGGGSSGRPVAAIIIGPKGVRVEPVVDATKIALAVFTTAGAMLMMLGRMRRMSRR
jgi:uncharacterized spore protein YtfJ